MNRLLSDGRAADRLVTWLAGLIRKDVHLGLTEALMSFRRSTIDVVKERASRITLTNVLQQLVQFLVLFIALRGIQAATGHDLVRRGTVDALITAILVSFGAMESDALAATLLWRASTFFPQIFIGIGTLLYWRRRKTKALAA